MKWYAYLRIVRKNGIFTFIIQHAGTGIEKKVYTYDIQLGELTEWDIDTKWFKRGKAEYAYYPTGKDKRGSTLHLCATLEFSVTSTDTEEN